MPHYINKNKKVNRVYDFPDVEIFTTRTVETIDENGNRHTLVEKVPFDYSPSQCEVDDFSIENLTRSGVNLQEVSLKINTRFGDESGFNNTLNELETINFETSE